MTAQTIKAAELFVTKWCPRSEVAEFMEDLKNLLEIAVREATSYIDGKM